MVIITTWEHKVSKWRRASPHSRVCRYWSFALAAIIIDTLSIILKLRTNNKNSYGSLFPNNGLPFLKKSILNSFMYNVYDIGSLRNLILHNIFSLQYHYYFWLTESGVYPHRFVLHHCARYSFEKSSSLHYFCWFVLIGNLFENFHAP